jgi:hypothetical protein
MASFNIFKKKLKGENQYFKQRKAAARTEPAPQQAQPVKQAQPESPPPPPQEKQLVSNRQINKDLLAELLKAMRLHDISATVVLLANTIDNVSRRAGIMINNGYIPQRIVSYLQNINLRNIEDGIKLVKTVEPDTDGFYPIDERTAANLNLPLGCMILAVFHRVKSEYAALLVFKTTLKDKKKFVEKVKKLIER